jgi:hypothetical protein
VGQLDGAGSAVNVPKPVAQPFRAARVGRPEGLRYIARACVLLLAVVSMAHVGSPDTFFGGKAGPYDVRVSVRLPGVIPGRA